jgi:serine/threonine-protein kinase HipA
MHVLINNRLVGQLDKEPSGAIRFQYEKSWLEWEHHFPISLSLPARPAPYRGEPVVAVFENLLPDNPAVRKLVAERTGAQGADAYSLLEQIGRDCVGAMQFLPDGVDMNTAKPIQGKAVCEEEIEGILANLGRAPLGIDTEQEFRISVAGAQEKTALLFHRGRWKRPLGTTPTTHILKPQLGEIPTPWGLIDLSNSVENEHYCLKLLEGCGLRVAHTEIAMFGKRKVLVVERFDRLWRKRNTELLRLPQEDCCQALSYPSSQKYQNQGGPGAADILNLLKQSDYPARDQLEFLKGLIVFWLIGATDGHAKNFSIFLRPGGRFEMTPFYDVLSAQPAFDAKKIPHNKFKMAMSAGKSRHYGILALHGRHFVETVNEAGLGSSIIRQVLEETRSQAMPAAERALKRMPEGFHAGIHNSIVGAMKERLEQLETGFVALR